MPWTERQQTMLREMGHLVPVPAAAGFAPGSLPAPLPAAEPDVPTARAAAGAGAEVALAAADTVSTPTSDMPAAAAAVATPDAPPSAVTTLDWPALRDTVAACRACSLCDGRTQTVFGVGHQQAHWMVVGEAPGEQEDRLGEPFVGPAGQLLDRMLAALQLSRAADGAPAQCVYIANTLKCRPPRNRNPDPAEMARCEPYLVRQIDLLQPRLILAMGRFAVQALLRSDEPVGKLRGRVHRYHGVPLVVTYHPAYLLRNPADKAKAWDDLCLAAGVVQAARELQA